LSARADIPTAEKPPQPQPTSCREQRTQDRRCLPSARRGLGPAGLHTSAHSTADALDWVSSRRDLPHRSGGFPGGKAKPPEHDGSGGPLRTLH